MSLLCLRGVADNLPHVGKSHICVTTQGLSLIDETEQVSVSGVSLDVCNHLNLLAYSVFLLHSSGGLLDLYTERTALNPLQQIAFIHISASKTDMLVLGAWNRPRKSQRFGDDSKSKLTW